MGVGRKGKFRVHQLNFSHGFRAEQKLIFNLFSHLAMMEINYLLANDLNASPFQNYFCVGTTQYMYVELEKPWELLFKN